MISDKVLQETIKWTPHASQLKILKNKERDVVICAGRRFGKSAICAYVALKTLLKADLERKPVKIWIVAPTYDLANKVFDYLVRWYLIVSGKAGQQGVSFRPSPRIKTAFGSLVECKSADSPQGLLGEELDLLIVDECSRIKKNVYETYLYPTTTSRKGRTFFISTPFGKNWFYDQWIKAKVTNSAFQFTSLDGVSITQTEWERAREKLPTDVFEQEFMAQFSEGMGSVFRGVREIISDSLKEPVAHHRYVMGLDLAKHRDFSVVTVIDKKTHSVVYWDRFHKIPYTLQKKRIYDIAIKYNNCKIVIDSLNVGAALGDDFRASGLRVEDFKFTGSVSKDWAKRGSKERLVEKLSNFIEEKNLNIPQIDILVDELESFGYLYTESNNLQYGAPAGLHDDCVDSLALAVWTLDPKVRRQIKEQKKSIPIRKKRFQYL